MFLKSFPFPPWSVMRSKATNLHTITITKVNNVRMECLVRKRCDFNGILAVMMSISVLMMIVLYICWRLTQKSFIWIYGSIDSLTPNRNQNRRVYFIRCETCCKCSQNANNDCIQFWSVIVILHAASKCRRMNICSAQNGEDFPT